MLAIANKYGVLSPYYKPIVIWQSKKSQSICTSFLNMEARSRRSKFKPDVFMTELPPCSRPWHTRFWPWGQTSGPCRPPHTTGSCRARWESLSPAQQEGNNLLTWEKCPYILNRCSTSKKSTCWTHIICVCIIQMLNMCFIKPLFNIFIMCGFKHVFKICLTFFLCTLMK